METGRAALGLAATLLGCLVSAGCTGGTTISMSECLNHERVDYPRLEALAHEVLEDFGDKYQRVSFCEDSGLPRAVVDVSVYDWGSRREARRALRAIGLTYEPGVPAFTVDGDSVHYSATGSDDENGGRMFVAVRFVAAQ